MILQELKNFIDHRGLSVAFGTRDKDLQPSFIRGFGISYNESENSMSVFVPKAFSGKHLENLQNNGRGALTLINTDNHVAYQFKGQYISTHDCNENELKIFQENITAFGQFIAKYFGENMLTVLQGFNIFPLITITFKVEEIFNQTPGPGAGKKIN